MGFNALSFGTIAITLVVAAVILGTGGNILDNIQTAASTLTNATTHGFAGLAGMAEYIPIIAIVTVAVIIIGVVLRTFGSIDTSSEEKYIPMDKFEKEEEDYNKNYYKTESDFDEAKQSWFTKTFKIDRYKK